MAKVTKTEWPKKANLHKPRQAGAEARKLSKPFLALIALLFVVSVSVTVYAISNTLPDPAVQGNNTLLAIGRISKGSTLPSQSTSVKLAYQNKPVSVNVFDGAWCAGSDYDRGTGSHINSCGTVDLRADVEFKFQTIDNENGNPVGPAITVRGSTMAAAVGPNKDYTVNLSGLANLQSTDNRHFVLATVSWVFPNDSSCSDAILPNDTCPGGTNFFKFSVPGGANPGTNYVTYAVTNDDSFPLSVESVGPTAAPFSNISFEFAAPCGASDADRLKPLKWQDADYNESNQLGPISWDLFDETKGGAPVLHQENAQLGGQGDQKEYPAAGFQFINDHKYRWTWNNVSTNNGVQLFLPFDSYNYVRKCATVDIDKSATTHPGLAAGEEFAYNLTVKHGGPPIKSLTITDPLPSQVSYVADAAFNQPPPSSVTGPPGGQTVTWNFAAGSPEINTLNTKNVLQISFRVKVNDSVPAGTFTNKAFGSSIDVNGSNVPVTPGTTDVPVIPVNLTNKPFFSVSRGNASAGAGMSINAKECNAGGYPAHQRASVVGWNQGPAKSYLGAGATYGTFALNHIQGFVSAQNSAFDPAGLSFANTGGDADQYDPNRALLGGLYGGEFGGLDCLPDYFKNATAIKTGNQQLSGLLGVGAGGTYTVPNCNGSNAAVCHRTIYINGGNLSANVNVRFSGAYANTAAVPSFSIIVRGGNILIDPAVGQLDGFYVAQPGSATATNGVVYTCAPGGSVTNILSRKLSSVCGGKPLTFNGAVVARQVWLLRTFGSLSTNTPAESFNYAPEFWLNTPFGGSFGQTSSAGKGYDAITSLPPVL